tara:strand:+ start:7122 stop:7649 length:528 start_codon:yes stop_codon:yes gene_type:complete
MNFFQHQSVIPFVFTEGDTVTTRQIVDISQRAVLTERLRQYASAMHDYVIADGARPDTVAAEIYGDPKYTWVVLLVNNIMSLYDWPLSYAEFESYIIAKYGSIQAANEGDLRYFRTDGIEVDALTYADLLPEDQGELRTPLEHETIENENKRSIKVISPQFLPGLDRAVKTLFRR